MSFAMKSIFKDEFIIQHSVDKQNLSKICVTIQISGTTCLIDNKLVRSCWCRDEPSTKVALACGNKPTSSGIRRLSFYNEGWVKGRKRTTEGEKLDMKQQTVAIKGKQITQKYPKKITAFKFISHAGQLEIFYSKYWNNLITSSSHTLKVWTRTGRGNKDPGKVGTGYHCWPKINQFTYVATRCQAWIMQRND